MRILASLVVAIVAGACSTGTPLSVTPQKNIALKRDYVAAADCFYQRVASQGSAAISKVDMASQRSSEVKMQMDAMLRWSVLFADAGNGTSKATISTLETVWAAAATSAAAELAPQVEACG